MYGFSKNKEKLYDLLISFLLVSAIYIIFIAQRVFSDGVTFSLSGDTFLFCLPAFSKSGDLILNGIFKGVDTGTWNGATEFFLRSNSPNLYLPVLLLSALTKFFTARSLFFLVYVIQTFACCYFSLRLSKKYFKMNQACSVLFSLLMLRIVVYEAGYFSYLLIVTLLPICLYFSLEALNTKKLIKLFLLSIPYTLAFTSGYITLSLVLVLLVYISALAYGFLFNKNGALSYKQILFRATFPVFVAGIVCMPYYLQLLMYVRNVVDAASSTIDAALFYKFGVGNLPLLITQAFKPVTIVENMYILALEFGPLLIVYLCIRYNVFRNLKSGEKLYYKSIIGINIFIFFIVLGAVTPVVYWFYSLVPVLGSMHLPIRYMMITIPLFYLVLCSLIKYIPDLKHQKVYRNLSIIFGCLLFCVTLFSRVIDFQIFYLDRMAVFLFFACLLTACIYQSGICNKVVYLMGISVIFPALVIFYNNNETSAFFPTIKERSIVTSADYQKRFDSYVASLPLKERYMFTALETAHEVPFFIPGNYEWFGLSNYNISNLSGYEHHLCVPKKYQERFGWYSTLYPSFISYMLDTRSDFVIVDDAQIEKNLEVLNPIVDWNKSRYPINNNFSILTLKKFIPSYYTEGNQLYIEDAEDVMDNGYFYSYELKKDSIISFETDDATYFSANINAAIDSTVLFLLFPNRNYHYYVDGKEITPAMTDMQAAIPLTAGIHQIEVKYINRFADFSNAVFGLYYGLSIFFFLCFLFKKEKS